MLSIGSPKNRSPPCASICSRPRWIAPMLAALTLPYSVVNWLALSPTCCSIARRSFRSSSSRPLSSAILKTSCSTPCWISLSAEHAREQQRAHVGDRGAHRMALPFRPKTSHRVAGQAADVGASRPRSFSTAASLPLIVPACVMPVRSPFTSAMKTGTPIRLKFSARVCSVIVLPVPVAPVIRPWRLASAGSSTHSVSPCLAIRSGSAMLHCPK